MGVSGSSLGRRRQNGGSAPPPPGGFGGWDVEDGDEPGSKERRPPSRPAGAPFQAELDACELDDRERPGPVWTARGQALSRSNLILRSRRMCYPGRRLLLAVHLIDDEPTPLFGCVHACDYDGDGLYRVDLDLLPVPERPDIHDWLRARG